MQLKKVFYTIKHKLAYLYTEYKLTGKISKRGLIHDIDKIWMYLFTNLTIPEIHKIHRKKSTHHINDIKKSRADLEEITIDWECARLTKPDKQLNAVETLFRYYIKEWKELLPVFYDLGLIETFSLTFMNESCLAWFSYNGKIYEIILDREQKVIIQS